MEDYLKQFVHKFKEEAYTLLTQLEGELLELEVTEATRDHLETIFRVMHTLKGTAGMYGFEHIQNLTHHLETVYDQVLEGALPLNNEILELTLVAVDHIKNLLEDDNLEEHDNVDKQKELLEHVLNIISTPPEERDGRTEFLRDDVIKSDMSTFYIMIRIDQTLLDRGVSLINIFRDLAEYGTYSIVKNSSMVEVEDELWGIYYATNHNESILKEVFMFIEENVDWRLISRFNLFDQTEFSSVIERLETSVDETETKELQRSILDMVEEKYKKSNVEEQAEPVDAEAIEQEEVAEEKVEVSIEKQRNAETSRISVSAEKLDVLMHLVTELVTTQSQFSLAIQQEDLRGLRDVYERTQKLTKQFRDNTLDIRLVPIGDILIRFKRLVRDLAKQLNKKVKLETEGMETELDKSMIDSLTEPLLHLVRNCIDHGIETPEERLEAGKPEVGKIEIIAFHSGGHVFIIVRDDGAGVNHEKIRQKAIQKKIIDDGQKLTDSEVYDLMFRPSFSTAHVVSEVSGRGVGMDIVRQRIADIRGEIEVSSKRGVHTTFTLKLQPTIAIIDTMLVRVEDTYCLIPISDIEVCDQIGQDVLHERRHLQTLSFNGEPIPFIDLRHKLGLTAKQKPSKSKLLYINLYGQRFAVLVDKIIGEHQAVLKPLGEEFHNQKLIASASTLGDGSLAFMLDMNNLYAGVEENNKQKVV